MYCLQEHGQITRYTLNKLGWFSGSGNGRGKEEQTGLKGKECSEERNWDKCEGFQRPVMMMMKMDGGVSLCPLPRSRKIQSKQTDTLNPCLGFMHGQCLDH